ncbi:hypothetical protein LINPERHAP1_LOCUS14303 [Linum perenne]
MVRMFLSMDTRNLKLLQKDKHKILFYHHQLQFLRAIFCQAFSLRRDGKSIPPQTRH